MHLARKKNQRCCNAVDITQILEPDKIDKLFRAKSEYGQLFLFKSKSFVAVLRPLTVEETETLTALSPRLEQCAIEDWIFRTCYVTGNKYIQYFLYHAPYQVVSNIAAQIPILSHIQEEKEYKKKVMQVREETNKLQEVVETIITKAYMGYKDVKKLTQAKQFQLLARAEKMSGEMLDLGEQKENRKHLRQFTEGATVIGGTEHITSPDVADIPDFNEAIP